MYRDTRNLERKRTSFSEIAGERCLAMNANVRVSDSKADKYLLHLRVVSR
jgi:hypothetical protein